MAAEEILPLFDLFWFQQAIFPRKPLLKTCFQGSPVMKMRSQSEYLLNSKDFPPPVTTLNSNQKLETVLSGQVTEFGGSGEGKATKKEMKKLEGNENKIRRKKKRKGLSKSLSDLEFEELKGFMDLGFVFSEEDKNDSNLGSIIPGLHRLGPQITEEKRNENGVLRRPYLSEAWEAIEEENEKMVLMKWRVPSLGATEMDIKHHLKFWAHTVASTVR